MDENEEVFNHISRELAMQAITHDREHPELRRDLIIFKDNDLSGKHRMRC